MSVAQCQRETSSYDFLAWMEYLQEQDERRKKEEYYLAQIAVEIRRTRAKNPKSIKLEHGLLQFKSAKKSKQMTVEERTRISKTAWCGIVGLKETGNG
jgi:hypothetical protein